MQRISVIIPAKNEARGLEKLLPELKGMQGIYEIIVVNDGSTDDTGEVCRDAEVKVVTHPYAKGNGAAIKTGASCAEGEVFLFMDADGQHKVSDVKQLIDAYGSGFAMVVGARSSRSQANMGRLAANSLYNVMASKIVGHHIEDLTSGLRVANAKKFKEFLYLLPNGFSYPTTITMAFFRSGYSVGYVPIETEKRIGKSHINTLKDGSRFLIIIFKIAILYSPLKIFVPISLTFFLSGVINYLYTFLTIGRFTNMSALFLSTAVLVFLIGLVSEQITTLLYSRK